MKEYIIEKKDSGQRSDKYIARLLPNASKGFIYKMIRKKNIVLNDSKMSGNEILKEGDSVKFWLSDDTFDKFSSLSNTEDTDEYIKAYRTLGYDIEILYENDDFIILNKPAGVLSQRSDSGDVSLNEWLIGYLLEKGRIKADSLNICKPSVVNRLDRNTSGIVLAGRSVYGLNTLSKMVRERQIKKYYLAYVLGELNGKGLLEGYHLKDEDHNKVKIIDTKTYESLSDSAKKDYSYIKTGYEVLSHHDLNGTVITKLSVDLITGRSHQIRAHMAHIGHPLLGDVKYGERRINDRYSLKHQLLHAYKVVFPTDEALGELSGRDITCLHGNPEVFGALFSKNW
ncbi:MAG: RluA family pseudouridine synthase [Lachnospiraceae bacterium]|nr:RluA family pseudouridine synthase [Lachnospiraceae bacterium]